MKCCCTPVAEMEIDGCDCSIRDLKETSSEDVIICSRYAFPESYGGLLKMKAVEVSEHHMINLT